MTFCAFLQNRKDQLDLDGNLANIYKAIGFLCYYKGELFEKGNLKKGELFYFAEMQ